jgi:UDP-glucose 4-epimerase
MTVLVTGGAGYIGSHTVKIEGDILDKRLLGEAVRSFGVTDVIHFAGLSLVGESMRKPDEYYWNNVAGTVSLLNVLLEHPVRRIVFSSSAAVYGEPEKLPIDEKHPRKPTNVYGQTKAVVEKILHDYSQAHGLKYVSLRYFNACGAEESGLIGEDHDPETHLIPLVLETALGQRQKIRIYGSDYPTKDSTCIRDYIHVSDLATAHLLAMEYLETGNPSGVFNLGNGKGFSVKEVIDAAEEVTEKTIPVETSARRPGDPAVLVADSEKARSVLGWEPEYTDLKQMIGTAWKWHSQNPGGFAGRN